MIRATSACDSHGGRRPEIIDRVLTSAAGGLPQGKPAAQKLEKTPLRGVDIPNFHGI
jgi:hypothetical protein